MATSVIPVQLSTTVQEASGFRAPSSQALVGDLVQPGWDPLCGIRVQTYIYLLAPFEEVLMGRELGRFQDKKFPQQFTVSAGNRGMLWVCTVCMQLGPVILQQKKPLVWKTKIESEGQTMALHVWQKQPFYLCRKSPGRGEESKTNLMSRGTVRAGKENER